MGRHSTYSQDIADEICLRLEEGESLRAICRDERMPSPAGVLLWCKTNSSFGEQYAQAREAGYRLLADELLEIADDSTSDKWTDDEGNERTNTEVVARSRLKVDTRKWLLSKMLPKVYGEKITNELTGPNGGAIETALTVNFVKTDPKNGPTGEST